MKRLCTGFGSQYTHKDSNVPYETISMSAVWGLITSPLPGGAKENAQWIIPSNYHAPDAREFEVQRLYGKFESYLCWDIDDGNHPKETLIAAVRNVLGEGVHFGVYATQSATPEKKKWRVLVPLSDESALTGVGYFAVQTAFFGMLEEQGIRPDYAPARSAQLIYLPSRGVLYDYHIETGSKLLQLQYHPVMLKAQPFIKAEESDHVTKEGPMSIIAAFRRKHSTIDMLRLYGYETLNEIGWRSKDSVSGSYGGIILYETGRWYSSANSMRGIGSPAKTGGTSGDGFDLYVHHNCGGDRKAAEQYARQLLKEEMANDPMIAWGKALWNTCITVDGKHHALHEAGLKASVLAEESDLNRAKAEVISIGLGEHEGDNEEWELSWPPGLVGELAQWIYASSSRPIKQFSIAAAIYFFSVVGRKYNVMGTGLNVYLMLVAKTGRGKGVVKSAVDKVVAAIVEHNQDPLLAGPFSHEVSVSQAGLHKALTTQNPLCAYEEELGSTLVPLGRVSASENAIALRKMLTKLFDSGESRSQGIRQASNEKDTKGQVIMPTFTLAGDTQPHVFRRMLGGEAVDAGFAPRMVPFFFNGERSYHNKDSANYQVPPESLIAAISGPIKYALRSNEAVHQISISPEAQVLNDKLDKRTTDIINKNSSSAEIYNRVNVIVMRMAGILAVGVNYANPIVTEELFRYAEKLVTAGMNETLKILNTGGGGEGEDVRQYHVRKAAEHFLTLKNADTKINTYRTPKAVVDDGVTINDRFFLIKLKTVGDFAAASGTGTTEENIRKALAEAVRQDVLEEFVPVVPIPRSNQKLYRIGSAF